MQELRYCRSFPREQFGWVTREDLRRDTTSLWPFQLRETLWAEDGPCLETGTNLMKRKRPMKSTRVQTCKHVQAILPVISLNSLRLIPLILHIQVTSCYILSCLCYRLHPGGFTAQGICLLPFARPGKGESLQFALPRCVLWGPGLPSLCSASCNFNIVWRVRTATPWDMTQQQVKAF